MGINQLDKFGEILELYLMIEKYIYIYIYIIKQKSNQVTSENVEKKENK